MRKMWNVIHEKPAKTALYTSPIFCYRNLWYVKLHASMLSVYPVYHVTIMCVCLCIVEFSRMRLQTGYWERGTRTNPIGPEPFLPPSLSKFKPKIRNWTEKRKQTEWKVCEKHGTSQPCWGGPTDTYVQFISKLDRKHCRMLVGLLTRHINLQYMQHKMRRTGSLMQVMRRRKGNVGTHSTRMSGVGKGRDADLGLCQNGSRTNKRGEAERICGPG